MIQVLGLIVIVLVSFVATMELTKEVEKVWLKPWAFRIAHFPECPPWTRHYRLILSLGPRQYRWTV